MIEMLSVLKEMFKDMNFDPFHHFHYDRFEVFAPDALKLQKQFFKLRTQYETFIIISFATVSATPPF